jgi:hypothetical protein
VKARPLLNFDDHRAVRFLVQVRHPLLLLVVLRLTLFAASSTDWSLLSDGGDRLFGPHPLSTYADTPYLQAGPTALVLVRVTELLTGHLALLVMHVCLAAMGWHLLRLAEKWSCPEGVTNRDGIMTLVVGLPVLAAWSFLAGYAPHPEDALVLVSSVYTIAAVRNGREVRAAILIGLVLTLKPWSVAALPLLFGTRRPIRAGCVAVAIGLVAWLPFLLADPGTLGTVSSGFELQSNSTLHMIGLGGEGVRSSIRSIELLGTLLAAAIAARRRQWTVAVAAGCCARLLLDPAGLDYYSAGLIMITAVTERLVGVRPWRTFVLATGLIYAEAFLDGWPNVTVRFVALAVVLVSWLHPWGERRSRNAEPPHDPDTSSEPQAETEPVCRHEPADMPSLTATGPSRHHLLRDAVPRPRAVVSDTTTAH